jgi:peptidoglycan-associated lipoprotein
MKLIKLSAMLVLALAMTFAATGCKKKPINTTPLPNNGAGRVGPGSGPFTDNPGGFKPETDIPSVTPGQPGGGPLPEWNPTMMNQDRSKFAALTVHFAYDSAAIRSGERVKVESMAAAMQTDPSIYLLIEGHCDERGTEEYNRSLGEKRALSLREELVKAGVNPDRIRTLSFGEDKPASTGHDESAWSKNRRGEFIACTPKTT